jgi:hypothetical protein
MTQNVLHIPRHFSDPSGISHPPTSDRLGMTAVWWPGVFRRQKTPRTYRDLAAAAVGGCLGNGPKGFRANPPGPLPPQGTTGCVWAPPKVCVVDRRTDRSHTTVLETSPHTFLFYEA